MMEVLTSEIKNTCHTLHIASLYCSKQNTKSVFSGLDHGAC